MRIIVVSFGVLSFLGGCLGSGDAQIKLKLGDKEETLGLGTDDPDLAGSLTADPMTPLLSGDGGSFPFSFKGHSEVLASDNPLISFLLESRLNPADPANGGEPRAFGLGPMSALVSFDHVTETFNPVAASFFVDEWHFTGDGIHPWEIRAHSLEGDGGAAAGGSVSVTDASFHAVASCTHEDGSNYPMCGTPTFPDPVTYDATLGTQFGAVPCAAEIIKPFLGAGDGAKVHFDNLSSVKADGADVTLSCVQTNETAQGRMCGANSTVDSGGCSWHVTAAVSPAGGASGKNEGVTAWIAATTDASCADVNFCNSEWTSAQP